MNKNKKRIALKILYNGEKYYGFQRQPNKRTVEGEIIKALKETRCMEDPREQRYKAASRTDKGAHAISQVIAFNSLQPINIRQINHLLPTDIKIWAYAEVPQNFDPRRHAIIRQYKYYKVYEGEDIHLMQKLACQLIGTHNFHGFCIGKPKNPYRTIILAKINLVDNKFLEFNFAGNSFLPGMIRKIVATLSVIGKGQLTENEFQKALNIGEKLKTPLPPANGLILFNIVYRNIRFKICQIELRKLLEEIYRATVSQMVKAKVHHVFYSYLEQMLHQ